MKIINFYGRKSAQLDGISEEKIKNRNWLSRADSNGLSMLILRALYKANRPLSRNEINKELIKMDPTRTNFVDFYYNENKRTSCAGNSTFATLRFIGLIKYNDKKIELGPNFPLLFAERPNDFPENENSIRSMLKA